MTAERESKRPFSAALTPSADVPRIADRDGSMT